MRRVGPQGVNLRGRSYMPVRLTFADAVVVNGRAAGGLYVGVMNSSIFVDKKACPPASPRRKKGTQVQLVAQIQKTPVDTTASNARRISSVPALKLNRTGTRGSRTLTRGLSEKARPSNSCRSLRMEPRPRCRRAACLPELRAKKFTACRNGNGGVILHGFGARIVTTRRARAS